uniref:Secreted protein n=1 Tax=Haptolina brevifila TaxID=156173 RepID=A0A7S2NKX7_9EUKA
MILVCSLHHSLIHSSLCLPLPCGLLCKLAPHPVRVLGLDERWLRKAEWDEGVGEGVGECVDEGVGERSAQRPSCRLTKFTSLTDCLVVELTERLTDCLADCLIVSSLMR